MPTLNNKKRTPNPRKNAPNKLISNSLNMTLLSFAAAFARDISNTKNHAVKKIPIANPIVARCGNTAGLIGDVCRTIDSMLKMSVGKCREKLINFIGSVKIWCLIDDK